MPSPGSRVVAMCGLGGFAEQVVVPAAAAVPIPDKLDILSAATFVQSYCTALFALRHRGNLRPGESVLVLGAGGGVGLAAVQVASALGATVLGAASTPQKREAARDAGASAVVNTEHESVKDAARAFSDGGVDLVLDPVGGALAGSALRALRTNGRYRIAGQCSGLQAGGEGPRGSALDRAVQPDWPCVCSAASAIGTGTIAAILRPRFVM